MLEWIYEKKDKDIVSCFTGDYNYYSFF